MINPTTIFITCMFLAGSAAAQDWHAAGDTLKMPKSTNGLYASSRYFDRYDTIPCTLIIENESVAQNGYKVIYVQNGFYTDNPATLQVFLDDQRRRILNVEKYHFQ